MDLMAIAIKVSKPLYNVAKVIGPFFLAQSKIATDKYSDFKLDKTRLEAIAVFLKAEAENLAAERSKLRATLLTSSGMERVKMQEDYNLLSKEINRLSTLSKVKDFFSEEDDVINEDTISDTWADRFNQLASSLNEEWRSSLLAKAYALELKKPGTVDLTVLNCIASFDIKTFKYFKGVYSVAIRLYEVHAYPASCEQELIEVDGEKIRLETLWYKISHLNLISQEGFSYIKISNSEPVYLRYGRRVLELLNTTGRVDAKLDARMFTPLGNKISQLYEKELCDTGNVFLDKFKEGATKLGYLKREFELSDDLYASLGD